ncbi:MAG: hypothetical protein JETT_2837 [Candidatus Jettenia ecosi]|uniref:PEP-CTERM protein-sorting domain-containing protein n=1 Tax=Candidatus Jettenia ecosi TaxID=2494326 RepID=A0A533Q8D2_9BACT|nr:MAG: hypothetical protein JETT_2837 [Candidatus Jettenia ecosi]
MKKNVVVWFSILLLHGVLLSSNIFAGHGATDGAPPNAPEPLSYILLLAGGATLAVFRRWRAKKGLKNLDKQS